MLSTNERLKLVRTLNSLPQAQLEELIFVISPPPGVISSSMAPQGSRAIELLRWIESPTGPGSQVLQELLAEITGAYHVPKSNLIPTVFLVPYERNIYFTGRDQILEVLYQQLDKLRGVALVGLGGIGKTQIALEYVYRQRENYSHIFWVNAESIDTFTEDYSLIADSLDLTGKRQKDKSVSLRSVRLWLNAHTDWLLVVDNLNDLKSVRHYLPETTGHILLTTRDKATREYSFLVVPTLSHSEGIDLLLRRTEREESAKNNTAESVATKELAVELGFLPLALEQAAAYIKTTAISFQEYLERYRRNRLELIEKDSQKFGTLSQTISTTWALNLEEVRISSPIADDLMRACAFLAPDNIPEEIFTEGALELGENLSMLVSCESNSTLLDAISPAVRFSLITRNSEANTLSIHPLVQEVILDKVNDEEQAVWANRVINALNAVSTKIIAKGDSISYNRILPHTLVAVELAEKFECKSSNAAQLFNQVGSYLLREGRYGEAEPLLVEALIIRKQLLGSEHPEVATTLNNLALLYQTQGRYEEAESLFVEALVIRKQLLGSEHPEVATTLNNLALLYQMQGRYEEAEPLLVEALVMRKQLLGSEHPEVSMTLNNLALLYQSQGRYKDAEPLFVEALAMRKQLLGSEHPEVATTLNNLASLYQSQERYEEAEPLYRQAISMVETLFGRDHPSMVQSLYDLAQLYRILNGFEEAETLLREALAISTTLYGSNHPLVKRVQKALQLFDIEEQRKQLYPKWRKRIYSLLLEEGQVSFEDFPAVHHDFIYEAFSYDYNSLSLVFSRETLVLEIGEIRTIDEFKAFWAKAKNAFINNISELFCSETDQLTKLICRKLGFEKLEDFVSFGQLHGWKIDASNPAFELNIRKEFPIIYIRKEAFRPDDVTDLVGVLHQLHIHADFFGLLINFDEHERIRELLRRSAYKNDFIVLGFEQVWNILAAKSPLVQLKLYILEQIDLIAISPYTTGGPVQEKMFFGRAEEEKTLLQNISENNYALLANRKAGKTSLINRILPKLTSDPRFRVFFRDLQAVSDYKEFFDELSLYYKDFEEFSILEEPVPLDFRRAVIKLKRSDQNHKFIFIFDEADQLLEFDLLHQEGLFKTFRSLSQHEGIRFVFSGTTTLVKRVKHPDSPLFNFCNSIKLELLERKAATELIVEPIKMLGIKFEDQEYIVGKILTISERHPNIIQYICAELIKAINKKQQRVVSIEDLTKLLESQKFYDYFEGLIWGQSTALEKLIVYTMWNVSDFSEHELIQEFQRQGISASDLAESLESLQMYSTLSKNNARFSFTFKEFSKLISKQTDIDILIQKNRKEYQQGE